MILSCIYFVKLGSFSSLPRRGSGVKYGLSVSINIFFRGIFFAVSAIFFPFLKVTIPEKLILQSGAKSISFLAYLRSSL
jgi:hypothetical protein